jgi:hypothetical protein
MKTNILILSMFALILSACSTGSYVSTSWVDDVYFSPGDVPPPVVAERTDKKSTDLRSKSAERVIVSEIRDNDEGSKSMNNYIFDGQSAGSYGDAQLYNLDQMELAGSDTTVYYDENEVKYVINNYFEGEDLDFSYRIHRFHRPYFHDPYFYDYYGWGGWSYPYSRFSWSYGWGGWYDSYYSWNYPYSGWYSPYYSWYSPMYSYGWGYPWYSWHSPYYGGYWGNVRVIDSDDYRYGRRRDYNTNAIYGAGGAGRTGTSAVSARGDVLKSGQINGSAAQTDGGRTRTSSEIDRANRTARTGTVSNGTQTSRTHTELRRNPGETVTERNRYSGTSTSRSSSETGVNAPDRRSGTTQGTYTRPVNPSESTRQAAGSTYTPSYNQQRSTPRQTYNVQGSTRPSTNVNNSQGTVTKSATVPGSTYTRPSGTGSSTGNTYRSTSTYNRSTSSGTSPGSRSVAPAPSRSSGSYSAPVRSSAPSSSGSSYSAPARSSTPSSSGSISTGGGSSSGSSSGSRGGRR